MSRLGLVNIVMHQKHIMINSLNRKEKGSKAVTFSSLLFYTLLFFFSYLSFSSSSSSSSLQPHFLKLGAL